MAAFDATDWEDAVRRAIYPGGDTDTVASIAGALAEPFFVPPPGVVAEALSRLSPDLLGVVENFNAKLNRRSNIE